MKVEIIRETGAVIGEKPHMPGEVLEVDANTARLWIKRGHAKVYEEKPTPKPKPITRTRDEGRGTTGDE